MNIDKLRNTAEKFLKNGIYGSCENNKYIPYNGSAITENSTNMNEKEKEYLDRISKMTNEEILIECALLFGGDDYDGCYTKMSMWEFKEAQNELYKRLKDCKFI